MASKTAAKSKAKPAPAKKPAPKPAPKPRRQGRAGQARRKAGGSAVGQGAAKPATGKPPVSNVEAIKALAIKAGPPRAAPRSRP